MKTDLQILGQRQTLLFWCAGCDTHHAVTVVGDGRPGPVWAWNGDRDRPTLAPSVRVYGTVPLTSAEVDRIMAGETITPVPLTCHLYLTDGVLNYLSDTTHRLSGQQVPLEDLP